MTGARFDRRREDEHFVARAPSRTFEHGAPGESFDRIAFAMQALDVLRPEVTVAVYPRTVGLEIERPLDTRRRDGARAAVVGIPPYASRELIAVALVSAVGREPEPWLVATLAALRPERRD